MLEFEEALARILEAIPTAAPQRVKLEAAAGLVLAEPVVATVDLPRFNNSSMDGYAVRAADTREAKPGQPVRLRLAGRVAAGERFAGAVASGESIRLFTGSPLPEGST